jgi:FecR-like protein
VIDSNASGIQELTMLTRQLATAILVALSALTPVVASAQASRAGIVTTLEGSVTVTRVSIAPQPLKFKDDVFVNDKITAGPRSLARMLLDGKAVVTVREQSTLTITEMPGKVTIDLHDGKIALAVAREKMKPGESIELRTPNAVAGVRGTVVVAEVKRASAQLGGALPAVVTAFSVLKGQVEAFQLDAITGAIVGNPVPVGTLQQFRRAGFALHSVVNLTPEEVADVVAGLSGKPPHTDDGSAKENAFNQGLQLANVALLTGLPGGGSTNPQGGANGNGSQPPPILPGNIGNLNGLKPPPPSNSSNNCHSYGYGYYGGGRAGGQ